MDTTTFLKKILPEQGLYVLAAFRNGLDKAPAHSVFDSIEQLASAARAIDSRGIQVFHACASYSERRKKAKVIDGREVLVEATRKANNVAFVRSQWLDIDVGEGKDYSDRKSAAAALAAVCKDLGIPTPMVVGSGRGFHCYWVFTEDVPAEQARRTHTAFSEALKAKEFKHDSSRTADLASILRPVGTHWRKEGAVAVSLLRDAPPVEYSTFAAAVSEYVVPEAVHIGDEWSTGPKEYPPSSALQIIKFCPAMAMVANERGNVPEPLWRAMLGIVKHTVEGEALAHKWSAGHPSYDPVETQSKFDNWTAGPTSCSTFAGNCDACAGCKYAEKKSPIHLGYTEDAPPQAKPEVFDETATKQAKPAKQSAPIINAESYKNKSPTELPFWPEKGYAWDGTSLRKAFKDEDGQTTWVEFCRTFFYPFLRFQQEDGTWAVRFCALVDPVRRRWREAEIPSAKVAENQALANALAAYEIFSVGKHGKELMKQYMQDMIGRLNNHNIETVTYNGFGWHDGGFVVGDTKITAAGEEPVLLGAQVPPDVKGSFGVAGSAAEWSELINTLYNRKGAEPYQFIICAAFGAPLIKLTASDLWHGIPIALTGDTGLGKTTTCMVACSMYGKAKNMYINTQEQGATMNALIQRVAVARNLPIVLDEITGRTSNDMQGMLFALSNGKPKERLRSDGSSIGSNLRWDTISFVTGNLNITSLLAELDRQKAEATQMRCFEIALPAGFNSRVFAGVNAKELTDTLLGSQYGVVGREYLQFVMRNEEKIVDKLQRMRHKFLPTTQEETRERFYYDLMVTALMGGAIAKQLGLISFDLNAVREWADNHIRSMRIVRGASTYAPEDYFQEFMASLHGRTVVTKGFRDLRMHKNAQIEFIDERGLRDPIARHAVEDRKFLISAKGFNTWCADHKINATWLRDELDKRAYFVRPAGSSDLTTSLRLFKGTNLAGTQTRVLELNYDLIDNGAAARPSHLTVVAPEPATRTAK